MSAPRPESTGGISRLLEPELESRGTQGSPTVASTREDLACADRSNSGHAPQEVGHRLPVRLDLDSAWGTSGLKSLEDPCSGRSVSPRWARSPSIR